MSGMGGRSPVRKSGPISALLGLAALVGASSASASGFSTARFGGELGHATSENATAIYYNPAALSNSTGLRFYGDASLALRWATFDHPAPEGRPPPGVSSVGVLTEPADAQGANYGKATLFNVFGGPMFGASYQMDKLTVAVGLTAPFGGSAKWDTNDKFEGNTQYPGAVDGVARWHVIEGDVRVVYFSAAASYEIFDGISVGLAANLVNSQLVTVRARNANGSDRLSTEGRSFFEVSGTDASVGAGFQYTDGKANWFGLSYQSQPGFGEQKLSGTLTSILGGALQENKIDFYQSLPDVLRASYRTRVSEQLELRFFGDITRWSRFDRQCLARSGESCDVNTNGGAVPGSGVIQNFPRDWRDAYQLRASASYWLNENTEVFGGVGFDSNAVPDSTLDPAFMDGNDFSVALGGRFRLSDSVAVAGSYTHLYYLERDNTGSSEVSSFTRSGNFEAPSNAPDAGGVYTHQIGVINVNAELVF